MRLLPISRTGALFLLVAASITRSQSPIDQVVLTNTSGAPVGVLASGQTATGFQAYRSYRSSTAAVNVGSLSASASIDEVIAFTSRRPVAFLSPVTWTAGVDNQSLAFATEIAIPVTVWIVKGPFATKRSKATSLSLATSTIWQRERMGIVFASFNIVDATTNVKAAYHLDFDCTDQTQLQLDIGKVAGQINVYMVNTVDGAKGWANACRTGGDFVAIGSTPGSTLLAHELGHDLGLTHIDDLTTDFDGTNVMYSYSNQCRYFTEGQVFRAHVSQLSALNCVYLSPPVRTGPIRDCPRDTSSNQCPPIGKRIWADGNFPQN